MTKMATPKFISTKSPQKMINISVAKEQKIYET